MAQLVVRHLEENVKSRERDSAGSTPPTARGILQAMIVLDTDVLSALDMVPVG